MIGRALLHRVLHAIGLEKAQTQLTAEEQRCIARYAYGRRRLAELGVFEGASTALLVRVAAPRAEVYGVDPFFPGRLGICWARGIARKEISGALRANPDVKVTLLEFCSQDAARKVAGEFDFIFVDGDHSLEGITQDWASWAGRVVPGGIIALHDTRVPAHNPRVANLGSHVYFEATIRHDTRFALLEQVDSLSILERSGT